MREGPTALAECALKHEVSIPAKVMNFNKYFAMVLRHIGFLVYADKNKCHGFG